MLSCVMKHLQSWNHLHEQVQMFKHQAQCSFTWTRLSGGKHFITNSSSIKQIRGNHMTQLTKGFSVLDELLVKFISNRTHTEHTQNTHTHTHTHSEEAPVLCDHKNIFKLFSEFFSSYVLYVANVYVVCGVVCVCEHVCVSMYVCVSLCVCVCVCGDGV